jgi:hypothetical protein
MKNHLLKKLVLVFLAFSMVSCATLFGGGTSSRLTIESNVPLKVKVLSDEGSMITKTTPFTIEMDRQQSYTVKLQADQYESDDIYIGKKLRGLAYINLLCLLCWAIDLATGNAFTHKKHHVYIDTRDLELKKAQALDQNKNKFTARIDVTITGTDESQEPAVVKMHNDMEFSKV